jgi:small GTP-binding protein
MGNTNPTPICTSETHKTDCQENLSQAPIILRRCRDTPYEIDNVEKVALIGDSGSGKTSLLTRVTKDEFIQPTTKSVGIEFGFVCFEDVVEKTVTKLQIWDTAGEKRYQVIADAYLKGCAGVAIIFDCTSSESFKALDSYITQVGEMVGPDTVIYIVRNKIDEENQQVGEESNHQRCFVTMEQTREFATAKGCFCMETSAKMDINVGELFEKMAERILFMRKRTKRDLERKIAPFNCPTVK